MESNPRKRGGQPGNTNALRHGFYSRRFTKIELADLDNLPDGDQLADEISLFKVLIRRMFEQADTVSPDDYEAWLKALNMIGLAMTRLAGVVRAQSLRDKAQAGDSASALSQAIARVRKDFFAEGADPWKKPRPS